MNTKPTTGTIIRTVVLIVALVNQVLTMSGHCPLPFDDAQVEQLVSGVITIVASLVTWWHNNSFTGAAIEADKTMKTIKAAAKNK